MTNTKTDKNVRQSWVASNKPLLWACIPVFALSALFIGISIFESSEEHRFQSRILQMQAEGVPVDKPSLVAWTKARTSTEGALAWSEIAVMQELIATRNTVRTSNSTPSSPVKYLELSRALALGAVPPSDENSKQYLESLRPLFRSAEQAVGFSKSVLVFDPSIYRGPGQLAWDLRFELLDAMCRGQIERSTAAMELLFRVNDFESSRNKTDDGSRALPNWGTLMECTAINNGLYANVWDEPFIRKFIDRLQPMQLPTANSWRSIVIRQRALGLTKIPRLADPGDSDAQIHHITELWWIRFSPLPLGLITGSIKNYLLDSCESIVHAADQWGDRMTYIEATNVLPEWRQITFPLLQIPEEFDFVRSSIGGWNNRENEQSRRLTRTALAVKLFHLTKGRWPKDFGELSDVGLPGGETQTLSGETFGYEVSGEAAYVWLYRFPSMAKIAPDLKSILVPLENVEHSELVKIR